MIKTKRGFTLVELLVVVAIIGILATVVGLSVIGAQKKARDTKDLAAINDFIKAAQACVSDEGSLVTAPATTVTYSGFGDGDTLVCTGSSLVTAPVVTFVSHLKTQSLVLKADAAVNAAVTIGLDPGKGAKDIVCNANAFACQL